MQTLIGKSGIEVIIELLNETKHINGVIVEVGVYKGGSAKIICEHTNKEIYLFDTFEGIPYSNSYDNFHVKGDFSDTSIETVKSQLPTNVNIFKGIFPEENSHVLSDKKISFVHLDVDVYDSYLNCLNFLYDKISIDGVILFDDYYASTCLGAKKAIDEFFADKKEKIIHSKYENSVYIRKQ